MVKSRYNEIMIAFYIGGELWTELRLPLLVQEVLIRQN